VFLMGFRVGSARQRIVPVNGVRPMRGCFSHDLPHQR